MNSQKSENLKKIIIALVVLSLFGVSYYYYSVDEKKAKIAKKPLKIAKKIEKTEKAPPKPAPKVPENTGKTQEKKQKNTIKPTNKKDLIANAIASGKNDPFSYTESNFMPFRPKFSGIKGQKPNLLPVSPKGKDYSRQAPPESIIIKGFLGNKVIAQIKGLTESLGPNESLQGVKVVGIDPANLSCDFIIDGKKVTKTMKPITPKNKNIKVNYVNNQ